MRGESRRDNSNRALVDEVRRGTRTVYFTDQQETECSVRRAAALVGRAGAPRPRRLLRPALPIIRAGEPARGAAGRAQGLRWDQRISRCKTNPAAGAT
jgi:hypothetical protein